MISSRTPRSPGPQVRQVQVRGQYTPRSGDSILYFFRNFPLFASRSPGLGPRFCGRSERPVTPSIRLMNSSLPSGYLRFAAHAVKRKVYCPRTSPDIPRTSPDILKRKVCCPRTSGHRILVMQLPLPWHAPQSTAGAGSSAGSTFSRSAITAMTFGTYICVSTGRWSAISSNDLAFCFSRALPTRPSPAL